MTPAVLLTVGESGAISTGLSGAAEDDTRTVGVKFEVLQGDADFDGETGPVLVPVSLLDGSGDAEIELVARSPGDIQVRVTWLEEPTLDAGTLTCSGATVDPHSFDLAFTAEEADRMLLLDIESGDEQEILEGEESEPLVVQVKSSDGSDTDGLLIQFEVDPSGVVVLSQSSALTDEEGVAEISVTGLRPGEAIITAFIDEDDEEDGGPVFFDITVLAEDEVGGANLSIVAGDGQTLALNTASEPLIVVATDDEGGALDGEDVSWRVEPADAAVLETARTGTDGAGKSQNQVRALRAGPFEVVAELQTGAAAKPANVVRFALTAAQPASGARLSLVSGNNQNFAVNAFSEPLVVSASDRDGNPLVTANVNWRIEPPTAGTLDRISSVTDSTGKTQNRVQALQSGGFTVVAQLAGETDPMAAVRFAIGAESVPVGSTLTVISGNNQGLVPGQPSEPLLVELRNGQGQPVAGALLRFTGAPVGAVNFNPPQALTGADGRASTRVAPQLPGGVTVTVTVVGDPSITTTFSIRGGTTFIPGLNANQQGVAGAIDAACPQLAGGPPPPPGGAQADLLARCSEIVGAAGARPADVSNALNQLLPDEAAPQATASLEYPRLATAQSGCASGCLAGRWAWQCAGRTHVQWRQRRLAPGYVCAAGAWRAGRRGRPDGRWTDFTPGACSWTGTIGRVDRDTTTNNPGFDGDTLSLTGGIDYRFSNRFVGGLALGYDDNDIALVNDTGSIDTRSLTLSAYGSFSSDNNFYIDGRLAYGRLDFDLLRNIRYTIGPNPVDVTAQAAPEGDSRLLAISLGRNFNRNAWNFGGYLRGELSTIELDGYSETILNAGRDGRGLAVQIDSRELESRTATLGARLGYTSSRDWGVLLPFARVEWVHEFEDEAQTVVARFVNDPTRTAISITGEQQDDGYGNVALGLSSIFANGRSAFLQYERRFAQDAVDRDSLSIGGRFEF